jgi:hypothetical protein
MQDSRLLELLRTFQPAELTALGKWLRSPFVNQRDDVVRLFGYLTGKLNAPNDAAFDKKTVAAAVFPGEPFDEKRLAYAMSFLHRAVQSFLVYGELTNGGEAAFHVHLAKALRKRGLERHFETALKRAEQALDVQPHRSIEYHYLSHLLHLERYESGARMSRTAARSFQDWSDATTLFFIANKLRQSCTALTHKAVSETNFRLDMLDETLQQVERQGLQQMPAIGMYYFGYKALTETDSKPWFGLLREMMRLHFQRFPKEELRDIYLLAVNYCIRQINAPQQPDEQAFFLRQVFDLYREGLENEAFLENGALSRFTYNNIANAGLGLKAFDWVEEFLTKYKDLLEPRHRESAYLFNLASLHFRKPDYGRALELLTQAEFDDVLHNLDARRMLLRIYFDLGELTALDSLLDSFTIFLRRHKDVGYLRQHYLNLIRFTKKLLQTPAQNRTAREKLRSEIIDCKALAEREWLLGKV